MGRSYTSSSSSSSKKTNNLLCGLVILVAILAAVVIGFSIGIIASLPTMQVASMAPVEMNERMKQMEKGGQEFFEREIAPHIPNGQISITLPQVLGTIDNINFIMKKISASLSLVPNEVLAEGIKSAISITMSVDDYIHTPQEGEEGDKATPVWRIANSVAEYLEKVPADRFDAITKGFNTTVTNAGRLLESVETSHWKDMIHKMHSILSSVESDDLVDKITHLSEVAWDFVNRITGGGILTQKTQL